MSDLVFKSASELVALLQSGQVTSVELTQAFLDRIEKFNPSVNSYLFVSSESALATAREVDAKRAAGETLPKLAGLPIAVKDNLTTTDAPTTSGSKILEGWVPQYDATVVSKLRAEMMPILGKTNLDEFAMGSSNESCAFGVVRNAADTTRVPGGSSGGSAVAVQADFCQVSLGTDTGGSIRMPAAFCGISGLKPTYGKVSRWGLIAYASSFDTIGPMGKFVSDLELVMEVIAGEGGNDSTLFETARKYTKTQKVAYIKEIVEHLSLQPEIKNAFFDRLEQLKGLGYEVKAVDFPYLEQLLPTYYVLTTAESSSNLSRFDGIRFGHRTKEKVDDLADMYKLSRTEGFGEEVQRRIMLGTFVLSADYYDAYYTKAQKVRRLIQDKTLAILGAYDFIISPTTSSTAYKVGEKTADPIQMYLGDLFTVQANITGLPAVSVPMGLDSKGLPMGFQVTGRAYDEYNMLDFTNLIQ